MLLAPTTKLEGFADVAGVSVEELFHGISFEGVDLRDEPISVLVRIDADYDGAILTRQQQRALEATSAARPERQRQRAEAIGEMRLSIVRRFIDNWILPEHAERAESVLVPPLEGLFRGATTWQRKHGNYALAAVRLVSSDGGRISVEPSAVVEQMLLVLRNLRVPIDNSLLDLLPEDTVLREPEKMQALFDFDLCTARFVEGWLDRLDLDDWQGVDPSSRAWRVFGRALLSAIEGPSKPPFRYIERILERARSSEELRELAVAVPPRAIDADMARTISKALAIDASDTATILEVLEDRELSPRVKHAFRRLILEAKTYEGRVALLQTIAEQGKLASGLEIDAVVADMSFQDIEHFVRPYWEGISHHHRILVINAMENAASTEKQKVRVRRLKERWLIAVRP